jgi:hypothetical protein
VHLLEESVDVLNPSKKLPATSHGVEQFLETRDPLLRQRFRRLDAEKLEAAKLEFAQLERSYSSWASRLNMVRKPDADG